MQFIPMYTSLLNKKTHTRRGAGIPFLILAAQPYISKKPFIPGRLLEKPQAGLLALPPLLPSSHSG